MPKIEKPATLHEFKFKKTLLWGLLSVNAVASPTVLSLWAMGEFNLTNAQPQVIQQQKESLATSKKAEAFALSFAHDYFTWNVGYEEHRANRLKSYLARGLDPQAGINFSSITKHARPEHIELWDVIDKGNKNSLIIVSAEVNLFEPKSDTPLRMKRLLAIPIQAVKENQFVVYDIPYYMPLPKSASMLKKKEVFEGDRVDAAVQGQIQKALENFFKVYFSGDAGEIAYLTKTEKQLDGYEGMLEFLSLDKLEVVRQGDIYLADCLVYAKDDTGTEITMPYQIQLTEENGRWFITDLINRD